MTVTHSLKLGKHTWNPGDPLFLFAGPCVIEDADLCTFTADKVKKICDRLGILYVFKASYDKANRSSIHSFRGPGLEKGLEILQKVKDEIGVPVLSDVHDIEEAALAAEVLDVMQIPAFLCRQTSLVHAVARFAKAVNVKKGQFLSPWEVKNIVDKVEEGTKNALKETNLSITERGASFGYQNLVVDMKSFPVIRSFGYPVVFDCSHSVQLPGGLGHATAGQREFIEHLARAAIGAGIDGLFLETHPDVANAKSDATNQIPLDKLDGFLTRIKNLHDFQREKIPPAESMEP
ncbi:MAG TPA: 3-deoxy-8-phosphooctulonate synthase [Firmicutes bacterium]|nr:3-deoxy-8-phosphooctulonate synthase [Bacillota bacterium]